MDKVWFVVRYLHLLAAAFFVGGQLMLAAVVVPSLRGDQREGLQRIARRFGYGTLIAFVFLIGTGVAMASHLNLWSDSTFQAKLGLVVAVAALIGWHLRRPRAHVLDGLILLVSLAIFWLGLYLANGWS